AAAESVTQLAIIGTQLRVYWRNVQYSAVSAYDIDSTNPVTSFGTSGTTIFGIYPRELSHHVLTTDSGRIFPLVNILEPDIENFLNSRYALWGLHPSGGRLADFGNP